MARDNINFCTFSIIWLDDNAYDEEMHIAAQRLRPMISCFGRFQDSEQCQQYIEQQPNSERFIIVASGQLGQKIVPAVHEIRCVASIYIYCMEKEKYEQWASQYIKVKQGLC